MDYGQTWMWIQNRHGSQTDKLGAHSKFHINFTTVTAPVNVREV